MPAAVERAEQGRAVLHVGRRNGLLAAIGIESRSIRSIARPKLPGVGGRQLQTISLRTRAEPLRICEARWPLESGFARDNSLIISVCLAMAVHVSRPKRVSGVL